MNRLLLDINAGKEYPDRNPSDKTGKHAFDVYSALFYIHTMKSTRSIIVLDGNSEHVAHIYRKIGFF